MTHLTGWSQQGEACSQVIYQVKYPTFAARRFTKFTDLMLLVFDMIVLYFIIVVLYFEAHIFGNLKKIQSQYSG